MGMVRFLLVPVVIAGCADSAVSLKGALQKGPFLLGSSVAVSPVDNAGDPVGQVFNTQTINDLGDFTVQLPTAGVVSLEGNGFFFNEVLGELSTAPITLRAYCEVSGGGTYSAYLNVITHLSYSRVKTLLAADRSLPDAVREAEAELRDALAIAPQGFDPSARGIDMNMLGGDEDANAYLLAVSAVIAKTALLRGGPAEATIQELFNQISLELQDDGEIPESIRVELRQAVLALNPARVMANLLERVEHLGAAVAIPDINRILDSDGDGFVNYVDTCPAIENTDQAVVPAQGCAFDAADTCAEGSTCPDGSICIGGTCQASACTTDSDCPAGEVCRLPDRVCVPREPACGDSACNGSEDCTSCPGDCGACPATCGDAACMDMAGESCETCPMDCGVCPGDKCGNGVVDDDEQCDDGNDLPGDGCTPDCRSEA